MTTISAPTPLAYRLFDRVRPIADLAARPDDAPEERLHKALLMAGSIIILPAAVVWGLLYLYYGETTAALITLGYAAINTAGVVYMVASGRRRPFAFIQLLCTLVLPFLLTVVLGGISQSSGVIFGALMAPLGSLLHNDRASSTRWFLGFAGLVFLAVIVNPYVLRDNNLPDWLIRAFYALNVVIVSGLAFFQTRAFIRQRDAAYGMLREEQDKTYGLLCSILPQPIADVLKEEERTIAERYQAVSILFVDVVGFTPLSAEIDAAEMVELLNELYINFDNIVEKYGLEKIRTMGDGYMVASGVPMPRPDHAPGLARAALEMMAFGRAWASRQAIDIRFRMGINSGEVMAGVIGRKKFSYDVWGDPVNIASRMESQSLPDKIQVAPAAYALLKDNFILTPRGEVDIKGKGLVETWFLEGERDQA